MSTWARFAEMLFFIAVGYCVSVWFGDAEHRFTALWWTLGICCAIPIAIAVFLSAIAWVSVKLEDMRRDEIKRAITKAQNTKY